MKRVKFIVLSLVAATALSSGPVKADDVQTILAGKAVAEKACAKCHSVGFRGESAAPRATPFRDLVSTWSGEELQDAVKSGLPVRHGPAYNLQLPPADTLALLAYLDSLATEASGE